MSGLWTPEGEHPASQEPPGPAAGEPSEADVAALRDQLARTPAAVVVANHCLGLWELAALHLSLQPPQLEEAALAIDALGAVIERLEGRLGPDEGTVRDALAQLRLAFVQLKGTAGARPAPASGDGGTHGGTAGGDGAAGGPDAPTRVADAGREQDDG